ncbi:OLC1v1005463C1 [Oldenlandia corymbosa var. corymbosa]|uniref:OLC1v1005463C1 n=1 Tax=Oldenlandia corymbosa var. corymbosa TaxID=529605 RepID=A0AAV1DHD0_OLDCO|nr:OLC1v1005463C1 [Oldenlandia corymbosa var. corymbosa]
MAKSSFLSLVLVLFVMITALVLSTVSASGEQFYEAAEMGWMRSGGGGGGGLVGEAEELEFELMDSESNRRILATARRYISYGALQRNSVPCSRRGQSYYNCRPGAPANPYTRGCSAITRCRR